MAAPTFGEGKRKRGLKGAAAKGALASSSLYNASRPLLAAASADPCMSAAAFAAATAAASPATAQHVRARRAAAAEAAAVHAASTHVLVTEENALMRRRGVRSGEALGGIGARDAYYGRNSRHAGAMLRGGARPRVEAARAESAACLPHEPKDEGQPRRATSKSTRGCARCSSTASTFTTASRCSHRPSTSLCGSVQCCAASLRSPQSRLTPRVSDSHVFDEYGGAERLLLGRGQPLGSPRP